MLFYRFAASALLMATSVTAQASAELASVAECWRADEAKAVRIQNLQTMLMVDAIKCQETMASTLEGYNAFLAKRQDTLIANKYLMQAHFVRKLGPVEGAKAATDYDTKVGNLLSASPISVDRCESTGMYARLATNASDDDLVIMADTLAGAVEVVECPAAEPAKAKPTEMVIPIWKKPAPPVLGTTETQALAAIPAQGSGLVQNASVPAQVPGMSSKPQSANNADAVKALHAAVAALNQVAATLQTDASGTALASNPQN